MSTGAGPLFSFRGVPVIANMLAAAGRDIRPLLVAAGLPDEALRGEVIAPLSRVQQLLDASSLALGDPLFGIHLAERVATGTFGVTEFLMRSAPTVARCLHVLAELSPLINPILDFRFDDGRLSLAVHGERDVLGAQLNEYTFALLLRQFSLVLGEQLPVEEIWFAHLRTDARTAVAARFGCRVTFGAADCGIALRRSVLDTEPPTADTALFEFLLAQARAQIGNLGTRDVISQLARVIETRLGAGSVSAEATAKAMATTVRSLQRHLADAGTTYREVLKHVRQRRRTELSRSKLPDAEIARRLGFSDAGSMKRSLDQ